jgi:hypothetical protein
MVNQPLADGQLMTVDQYFSNQRSLLGEHKGSVNTDQSTYKQESIDITS